MNIIIISLLSGVVGMGIGALLTAFFGNRTDKMVSIFLSFAGGVMLSIVFFELLPEAAAHSGMMVAIAGLALGVLSILVLNRIMDKVSLKGGKYAKLHGNYAEFFHASGMFEGKNSMLRSGMLMLFAIGLHNVPEGLAMGAAGHHDMRLGISLAVLISLHNIPEGMAVSAPLIAGGMSKLRSIILTLVVGSTTVVGAILGVAFGGLSSLAVAISFSLAGGAMLYVVFGEILPQSVVTNRDRMPTVFVLAGIAVGMLFTGLFA